MFLDFINNDKKTRECLFLGHIILLFVGFIPGLAGEGNASKFYYKIAMPKYSFVQLTGQGISHIIDYSMSSTITRVIAAAILIISCIVAYSIYNGKIFNISNKLFTIITCDTLALCLAIIAALDYKEQISSLLKYGTNLPWSVIDNIKYSQGFVFYFLLINLIFACLIFYKQQKEK